MGFAGMIPKPSEFNGQLDLYSDSEHNNETDLDIVVLDEGEMGLGKGKTIVFIF